MAQGNCCPTTDASNVNTRKHKNYINQDIRGKQFLLKTRFSPLSWRRGALFVCYACAFFGVLAVKPTRVVPGTMDVSGFRLNENVLQGGL